MGTVDFQTQNTFDRRIGRRLVLDGIDVINVTWMVPQRSRFGRAKPPLELAGRIENVSITGAAIVGPNELGLATGDEAVVRSEGRDSIVSVRHAHPSGDGRTTRYGVEITSVAPNLKRRIQELLDPTLARLPVEAPAPGRLSLRNGVARPAVPAEPVVVAAAPAEAPEAEPVAAVEPLEADAPVPAPDTAEPTPDDGLTIDLTDATMAAEGGAAVLDLTERATDGAPAPIPAPVVASEAEPPIPEPAIEPEPIIDAEPEPVIEPEPIIDAEPEPVIEPQPVIDAEPIIEPEPVLEADPVVEAALPIEPEAPTIDPHVPVAHPAHLPPVEMSEGRRVLDEVFGLMED